MTKPLMLWIFLINNTMPIYFSQLGTLGHLGNSLFQASCTIALAKRNNTSYFFPSTWKYKNSFNIPSECFINTIRPLSTYSEPNFHYDTIPYRNNMNISGYFQSEKYFKDYEADIRNLLTTKNNFAMRPGLVSIHVRRGDYLLYPRHHPTVEMSYYEKAMELSGTDKFLVFSDDIYWCKKHFIGNMFEFSEGNSALLDLDLQSKLCEHNIIGNSSFSWWAAWLNKNPNKKIFAPKKWFGPALSSHNTKDLFPNDWITI